MMDGPGRRLRKNVANVRKHIDYSSNALNAVEKDKYLDSFDVKNFQQPHVLHAYNVLPVKDMIEVPADCICTRFARAATNKVKCPVYSLCWNPDGRRLITGASSGEFTLWNGSAFNFETILQAHDVAIRAIRWSPDAQFMVSADHNGFVKYWQPNMNNVNMFQAHKDDPVRAVTFSPTSLKLATASDDGTARIFDFENCTEERTLRGHGSDVRAAEWHPTKGLIVTGSRDSQQPVKLWDPRTGNCLATLHDHKNSVTSVQWNKNGHWLLTGARDHLIKLYDIRMMSELYTFKGHRKEVTALAWHPIHETLFVSGGGDGSVGYWLAEPFTELGLYEGAHDQTIWALGWHPLGHILATGSNDNNTKFWGRNRPGDTMDDLAGMTTNVKEMHHQPVTNFNYYSYQIKYADDDVGKKHPLLPGLGIDRAMKEITTLPESIPGLPVVPDDYATRSLAGSGRKTLIKQPPPKKIQQQFERSWTRTGDGNFEEGNPNMIPLPNIQNGSTGPSLLGNRPNMPMGSLLGGPIQPQIVQNPTEGESWRSTPAEPPVQPMQPMDPWRQMPPQIGQFPGITPPFIVPTPFFEMNQTTENQGESWKVPAAPAQTENQPVVTSHGLPQLDPRKRRREENEAGS